jgi:hypothetical protein
MSKKRLLIALLTFLSLMTVPFAGQAATITACTFDKDTYHQGETGYITVTIFNDKEDKIRVTELSATINYYYTDENIYLQRFFTEVDPPVEIEQGNSSSLQISFSLPTNIASGYTEVDVKAITELWSPQSDRWFASEHPTHQLTLFIESPYKDQLEEQVAANGQLEEQLEEQLATNENVTNMMYLFGATTLVFAAVTVFIFILNRRVRVLAQPIV